MNSKFFLILALLAGVQSGWAQGTAFTYQGRLNAGTNPANGFFDLRFGLYDAALIGTQQGSAVTNSATAVSNGLFTVALDFGPSIFDGSARWLEIQVRTNGGGAFTPLTPRQAITPAPYAIHSANAVAATTAASAISVGLNAVNNAALQASSVDSSKIADGSIAVSDLGSAVLSNTFWRVNGNANTTPGAQFIGTTDNQPLEFRVNNDRALRLEPASVPNLIGGALSNRVTAGVVGAVIGGGGTNSSTQNNRVTDDYGTVAGGLKNRAGDDAGGTGDRRFATVGGGFDNTANGANATVAGGFSNNALAGNSAVGGGAFNNVQASNSTISGGANNQVSAMGQGASIAGGEQNLATGPYATILGGRLNNANGSYALAAGRRAKATNDGAFVWADSTDTDFASTKTNQFLIRAGNGVGIGTNNPQTALHVVGDVTLTGNLAYGSLTKLDVADNFVATVRAGDFLLGHPDRRGTPGRALVDLGDRLELNFSGDWPSTILGGKVGIGVHDPQTALQVSGTVTATAFSGSGAGLTGISGSSIAAGTIGSSQLAVGAVGSNQLAAGAVTTGALADGAMTAAKVSTVSNWFALTIGNPTAAAGDNFGYSVASVGNDRVLVGAPYTGASDVGAAYLFSVGGAWLTTFTNPTPGFLDSFGTCVAALGSDRVLIGTPNDNNAGAVYLFSTSGDWLTTFTNSSPGDGHNFGRSVAAVGNDRVLIGAPYENAGASDAGAAYLFSTNGVLMTTFTNPSPAAFDNFGLSIAGVGNDRVLIGAPSDDTSADNAGAAYLFSTNGVLLTTFANPVPAVLDSFGRSVAALGNDRVLIGAALDHAGALNAGAVYVFSTNGTLLTTFSDPKPAVQGFAVKNIRANAGPCGLDNAEAVLANPALQTSVFTEYASAINYVNLYGGSHFAGDLTFPGFTIGVDEDNFVLEATGIVTIPTSGDWTFGVNSDDGFRCDIGTNVFSWPSPRGPSDTLAPFNMAAGEYPVRLVLFECGGAAEVELFAASGTYFSFDSSAFRLVGDTAVSGLEVKSLPISFGWSVAAVGNDRVLVGAPYHDTGAYNSGGAYLFSLQSYTPGLVSEAVAPGGVTTASLEDDAVNSVKIADGTIAAADVNAASFNTTFWRTGGNAGTATGTHFIGTTDNQPLELRVNNQRGLRLEAGGSNSVNVIGGWSGNGVAPGAVGVTIAGGGAGNYFGFPQMNSVQASFGTISGGSANLVQTPLSVIAGGVNNVAGNANQALNWGSSVGGGELNRATGANSTVAGGVQNTASGAGATVGGGGITQFDSGGKSYGPNQASGTGAVVPGGAGNRAGGNFSFAAGLRAHAAHDGTFVWADDSTFADFASTANNQFLIRASGGVGIGTPSPSQQLHVVGNIFATGTITPNSDRSAKTQIEPVDSAAILERVAALPIKQWRFKTEEPDVKHLGPMAQDFHAAFGLGTHETAIATVDADGVALAAIQGLNRKLEDACGELKRRDAENAELKQRLEALEEIVRNSKSH